MGFSSTDDFVNEVTVNNHFWRVDYLKNLHNIGTIVAGRWYDLTAFAGNPVQYMHGDMVRNGDFMATADPWTLGGTWTYTSATHLMSHGTGNDGSVLSQTVKCVPGEKYTLVWYKGAGAGSITPSLGGTNGTARTTASTTYREDIIMGTTNALLSFTTTDATASIVDLVWLVKSNDFMPYTSETECAPYLGPAPTAPETKHLINMSAFNNALLGSPSILEIVDIIGVYPCIKTSLASKQVLQHSTRLRNGQFVGNATGWTLNTTSWAYGANSVVRTKTADTDTLSQTSLDILANVPYRLKFTLGSTTSYGGILTATIANGGTGFVEGPGNLITVTQAGAASGQLSCTANAGGVLTSINSVTVAGTNYFVANALATVGGNNNATVNITVITGGGTLTPSVGTVNGTPVTANGTYTQTITPTVTGGNLVFTPTSNNIAATITDVSLIPLFPERYANGAGLRFFAVTSPSDTLPTTGAQNVLCEYRNTSGWPTYTEVDSCDVTTNWTDSANMTVSVNTTNFKSGVGALNLTKDSVTTALTSTYKTTTSVNFTGKKLTFWFYCISTAAYAKLAAAASMIVRFGSDSSNYYQWTFVNTALEKGLLGQSVNGVGWQQIECSMLNFTSKVLAPDITAMDYFYIGLTASDGTTISWSAGDFVIDQIEVVPEASNLGATVSNTAGSIAGHILHSGAASGNIGPFMPLANGDSGVTRIENITFSGVSAAAGSVCLVVCKPIASIPLPYGFVAAERDFMSQLPSLPQIKDGACLGFILYDGAVSIAGTQWAGHLDIAWG